MSNLALDRLLTYAESSSAASGDEGQYVLAVVQTTLASSAADGEFTSFKTNLAGELYAVDEAGNALLTTIDADTGAIATSVASIDVDTTSMIALLTTIDADTGVIAGDTTSIDATLTALSKAEDAIHSTGDQGIMSLAVRNDAGTAFAADGDYIPLSTDATGNLRVAGDLVVAPPDTAIASVAVTVGTSEVALPTTPLAGRDEIIIQNSGSVSIFVGPTGVTTATGLEIGKRSNLTLKIGPSVDVFGISGTAGQDVRVFEAA